MLILEGVNPLIAEVRISPSSIGFHISHIEAKLKGGGRRAMEKLCYNADWLGAHLTINACPLRGKVYPGVWDEHKLVRWYEAFGFKELAPTEFMKHPMVRYVRGRQTE